MLVMRDMQNCIIIMVRCLPSVELYMLKHFGDWSSLGLGDEFWTTKYGVTELYSLPPPYCVLSVIYRIILSHHPIVCYQ